MRDHPYTLFIMAALLLGLASCSADSGKPDEVAKKTEPKDEIPEVSPEQEEIPKPLPDLQAQLQARFDEFLSTAPQSLQKTYEEGIRTVASSGVLDSALKKGQKAPDFSLTTSSGGIIKLSYLLKSGPVILTWYRGGWCPYCNIQLRAYQEYFREFRKEGAMIVAISPEFPEYAISTTSENSLQFPVLSDVGNRVARQYGIVYKLPEPVVEAFKKKFDLPSRNGNESYELPLAATFVVAKDGTIAYAFIEADYKKRADPKELIEVLKSLSQKK